AVLDRVGGQHPDGVHGPGVDVGPVGRVVAADQRVVGGLGGCAVGHEARTFSLYGKRVRRASGSRAQAGACDADSCVGAPMPGPVPCRAMAAVSSLMEVGCPAQRAGPWCGKHPGGPTRAARQRPVDYDLWWSRASDDTRTVPNRLVTAAQGAI